MPRKTNKTAHVLDLLTNGGGTDNGEAAEAAPKPEKAVKKTVPASAKKVTVVDNASKNDQVANDILNKLSEELDREKSEPEEAEPVVDAEDEKIEIQAEENEPQPEADHDKAEADNDKAETVNDPAPDQVQKKKIIYDWQTVNVMEEIVQMEDLGSYIKQYGVCTCSRCHADVAALILTSLPSKYVVVENNVVSPMVSFYRSKFKIRLLTEIAKACVIVKNNPRHNKNNLPDSEK